MKSTSRTETMISPTDDFDEKMQDVRGNLTYVVNTEEKEELHIISFKQKYTYWFKDSLLSLWNSLKI